MNLFGAALATMLATAPVDHCTDPGKATGATGPSPQQAEEGAPARNQRQCRIVVALDLGREPSSLEFVDVRAQPALHTAPGLRVLSFAQLEERSWRTEVTSVLLGSGLDDERVSRQCRLQTARQAVVLRGGVRAWRALMATKLAGPEADDGADFAEVGVHEALGAGVPFVFDVARDELLAQLLEARKLPYLGIDEVPATESGPMVYVADRLEQPPSTISPAAFYVRGGGEALRRELVHGAARAQHAPTDLRRPCYLQ